MRGLVDNVYGLMTEGSTRQGRTAEKETKLRLGDRLPAAESARMEAIIELVSDEPFEGRADLPMLAEESALNDKELLNVTSALTLLGFAQLDRGDIILTPLGQEYARADQSRRKEIFGRQLLENVPLVAYIRHGLDQDPSGDLPDQMFLKLLSYTLNEADADEALRVAVEWGRYGDLFAYDYNTGVIHLPEADQISS